MIRKYEEGNKERTEDTHASTGPNLHFQREMGKTNDMWIRP